MEKRRTVYDPQVRTFDISLRILALPGKLSAIS